jgi:hypothetical protein
MAEDLGTAALALEGDTTQLKKDIASAKGEVSKGGKAAGMSFSQGLNKATIPAAAALTGVVLGARKVISAASDMNEAVSAVDTTFGKGAAQIQKFSQSQSDSFSRIDFLNASKSFAVFGQAAELNDSQLVGFSKSLTDAAQDMSSFHNIDPTQVLQDLQSGLTGETEPLRKYGIILNEQSLNEEAWAQGIAKRGDTLTEQQKILARQSFILGHLGAAEGDYERTADSAANTEKRNAANLADTTAAIGAGLLPAYQTLLGVLGEMGGLLSEHTTAVKVAALAIVGLASAVLIVNAGLKVYKAAQIAATAATWLWNAALSANPIGLIIIALIALGAAIVLAWKKSETFRAVVLATWNGIKVGVMAVLNFFTKKIPAAFQSVLSWVKSHWPIIAVLLSGPFAPLVALATDAFGIRSKLTNALEALKTKAGNLASSIGSAIKNGITGALSGLGSALSSLVRAGINAVVTALRGFGIPGFTIDPPGPGSFTFGGLHPFSGIPYLDRGGVIPGPRGVHRLAWVAGGETVLPTHRQPAGRATVAILDGDREVIAWIRDTLTGYSAANGGRMPW